MKQVLFIKLRPEPNTGTVETNHCNLTPTLTRHRRRSRGAPC
jgi:hypothetical protein